MDWIHCNNCFSQLEPGITLHLTSCGHMFCNNCLANGAKESTCLVCRAPCSIVKLTPDMNPEIQDYFTEPEEIIKKSCEVLQFQRQHRRRLLSYLLQSTKKFYSARTELKRMTELCQKQHKQLKDYQKVVKNYEAQLVNQSNRQNSPFNIPISPSSNISPSFIQTTPTYKRTAKSTPYSSYQSNLVTPSRISKQRSASFSVNSQKSNTSNRISSTVYTPPTPESAGDPLLELDFSKNDLNDINDRPTSLDVPIGKKLCCMYFCPIAKASQAIRHQNLWSQYHHRSCTAMDSVKNASSAEIELRL